MYTTYICEFDKNVGLLEEQSKRNPAFGAVVQEFEVILAQLVFLVGVILSSLFMHVVAVCVCSWNGVASDVISFCSRPVHAVPTWLWSIIY